MITKLLVVPQFFPSIQKSVKQFGFSFAFGATRVLNEFSDKVHAFSSVALFRRDT